LVEQIMRSAEQVAEAAVAHVAELLPCAAQAGGDPKACGNEFIGTYGRRAYRRPLTNEDQTRLEAILDYGLAHGGLLDGIRLVITGMLESSHFLYRPEFGGGAAGAALPLSDWEIATRLSYLLVASCPDDALLAAAEAGALHTPEQIRPHA